MRWRRRAGRPLRARRENHIPLCKFREETDEPRAYIGSVYMLKKVWAELDFPNRLVVTFEPLEEEDE